MHRQKGRAPSFVTLWLKIKEKQIIVLDAPVLSKSFWAKRWSYTRVITAGVFLFSVLQRRSSARRGNREPDEPGDGGRKYAAGVGDAGRSSSVASRTGHR